MFPFQIYQEAKKFGKVYNIKVVCAYGGGSLWEQCKACEEGAEVIVATPVSCSQVTVVFVDIFYCVVSNSGDTAWDEGPLGLSCFLVDFKLVKWICKGTSEYVSTNQLHPRKLMMWSSQAAFKDDAAASGACIGAQYKPCRFGTGAQCGASTHHYRQFALSTASPSARSISVQALQSLENDKPALLWVDNRSEETFVVR